MSRFVPLQSALHRWAPVLAIVVAALSSTAGATAEPLSVTVDRAKVMRISRPADIVIIGNPAIADATIQDSRTLIITGRSYGTTNLIVLDSAGQPIADEILTVQSANDDVVTVFRRASRQTLSCTPDCSPVLSIGDNGEIFETVNAQVTSYGTLSNEAAQK